VSPANLTLRFLLELSALTALGYAGSRLPDGMAARIAMAVGAPLLAALLWGALVSPKARIRAAASVRLAVELAIFGAAAGGLAFAGRTRWALAFAAFVLLHEGWRLAERRPTRAGARAR
jgi:hypothetical protein